MRIQRPDLVHLFATVAASAVALGLTACGGGGSAAAPVADAAAPAVITQSTITLPSSVQVVSAK